MIEAKKSIVWLGSSRSDLKAFPPAVVDEMGYQLYLVQCGLDPDDWKPMRTVGTGVKEIRIRGCRGVYRTIYLAAKPEAIYVLHCFQKKTRKTARRDIEISRDRLKGVLKVW